MSIWYYISWDHPDAEIFSYYYIAKNNFYNIKTAISFFQNSFIIQLSGQKMNSNSLGNQCISEWEYKCVLIVTALFEKISC